MLRLSVEYASLGIIIIVNTSRPKQNGSHFADIFKCIFLSEDVWISIKKISLKFVRKAPVNDIPALVQIMFWHQPGDKPLSEAMMVRLPCIYASLDLNELMACHLWDAKP